MLSLVGKNYFCPFVWFFFPLGPRLPACLHKFRQTRRLGPDPNLDATEAAWDSSLYGYEPNAASVLNGFAHSARSTTRHCF
jgi:hypothetical protein